MPEKVYKGNLLRGICWIFGHWWDEKTPLSNGYGQKCILCRAIRVVEYE